SPGAVADACWHADHRNGRQAGDDRRESAVHPGGDHHCADLSLDQLMERVEEAVNACHSHVVDGADLTTHRLSMQPRLFRYRNVARASRQDTYVPSATWPRVARHVDRCGARLAPQDHALLPELSYQLRRRALTHPADNRPSTTIEQGAHER